MSTSHSLNAQLGNRAWQRTGLPQVLAEKKKEETSVFPVEVYRVAAPQDSISCAAPRLPHC